MDAVFGRPLLAHSLAKDANEWGTRQRLHPMDPMVIVLAYVGLGNNDQAIAWL